MTVTTNPDAGWNPDRIHIGEWVIQPGQEFLHLDAREAGMLFPFSSSKIGNTRQRRQFISIPPHTFKD
jgi:hypothetical protein